MAKKKSKPNITSHELRELRGKLHHLKPVVIIGNNGLTDAVLQEINRALDDHELIKIRTNIADRERRNSFSDELCEKCNALLVQIIGQIVAVFRKNLQVEE